MRKQVSQLKACNSIRRKKKKEMEDMKTEVIQDDT